MGVIRVLGKRGDTQTTWDLSAEAAIATAERIFNEQRAKGATAFRVDDDRRATRIDEFDPTAEQIVTVPLLIGG